MSSIGSVGPGPLNLDIRNTKTPDEVMNMIDEGIARAFKESELRLFACQNVGGSRVIPGIHLVKCPSVRNL